MQQKWTLYFWEPHLSPHRFDLLRNLASHSHVQSVTQIAQAGMPGVRIEMGWSLPQCENVATIVDPTAEQVERIVADAPADAVHIFAGMHWIPSIVAGLKAVVKYKRRFALISEPRTFEGAKGYGRLFHSWITEAPLRRNIDFILAIGRHGPAWFKMAGYRTNQIFPFCYFLPNTKVPLHQPLGPVTRVGFLGRMTKAKGIPLLLDALPLVKNKIEVIFAGAGAEQGAVEQYVANAEISARFVGVIEMEKVSAFMSEIDILAVPSATKDDGWGAVISEALLAGTAVVASNKVGGSICLDYAQNGRIVEPLTPHSLAATLDDVINKGLVKNKNHKIRSDYARKTLTGEVGASYLLSILDHVYRDGPRPSPFYELGLNSEGSK